MVFADQLRDVARVAGKAANPTKVLLTAAGFRVEVRSRRGCFTRTVKIDELEHCQVNPVVDAIRALNRDAA